MSTATVSTTTREVAIASTGSPGRPGITWDNDGWTSGTAYALNTGLYHNGSSYRAIVAHTSSAATEPGVGADWEDVWGLVAPGLAADPDDIAAVAAAVDEIRTAAGSIAAIQAAPSAAATAASARDAVLATGNIYPDTSAGLAAVSEGEYFMVPSALVGQALSLYRNVGGTAVFVESLPSSELSDLSGEIAGTGMLTERFRNNHDISATNITDAATPVYTVSHVEGGLQIALSTGSRTILFSTRNVVGGRRTRLRYRAVPTFASTCSVGIAFINADGDRSVIYYSQNGRITAENSYGGGGVLTTSVPVFASGDSVEMDFILHDDGTLYLFASVNGGPRYAFGFSGIPVGSLALVQRSTSTVVHSMTVEAVGVFADDLLRTYALPQFDSVEQSQMAAISQFMAAFERSKPTGFTPEIGDAYRFYLASAAYFASVDLSPVLSEQDPDVLVLHVDPATGSDTNPGTADAPLATIYQAMSCCEPLSSEGFAARPAGAGSKVIVKAMGGLYDFDACWRSVGAAPLVLQVVSWDGEPVISSMHDSTLEWAMGISDTYSATFSGRVSNVWDAANLTDDGDYGRLALAADLSTCQSTPGTYFISGTTIHVHAADGREPDGDIRVYKRHASTSANDTNGIFTTRGGTLYLENICFEGGVSPFFSRLDNAAYSQRIYARDCTFKYGLSDNFDINGNAFVVLQNCIAAWGGSDGFNYHEIFGSGGPQVIEIGCIARWNGLGSAGTNNGSTMHDGGWIVRVNGDYHHNQDRNIHDISGSFSWLLGCTARDSQTGDSNFCAGLTTESPGTKMWLDGCVSSGSTYDLEASDNSTIYHADLTSGGNNVPGGTITTYVP